MSWVSKVKESLTVGVQGLGLPAAPVLPKPRTSHKPNLELGFWGFGLRIPESYRFQYRQIGNPCLQQKAHLSLSLPRSSSSEGIGVLPDDRGYFCFLVVG